MILNFDLAIFLAGAFLAAFVTALAGFAFGLLTVLQSEGAYQPGPHLRLRLDKGCKRLW